jgi:hypothetical protein
LIRQNEEIATSENQYSTGLSMTKPVYCMTLGKWFADRTKAAKHVTRIVGKTYLGKDIRNAITRGGRMGGFRFSYEGPDKGRILSRPRTGNQRRVRCLEVAGDPFVSVRAACAYVGCSPLKMRKAIASGEAMNGYHFEFADKTPSCQFHAA